MLLFQVTMEAEDYMYDCHCEDGNLAPNPRIDSSHEAKHKQLEGK